MTVAQKIKSRIAKLNSPQQEALLSFLDTLEIPPVTNSRAARKPRPNKTEISAAVRGIAGMWKDRTDLPKDPVQAVKAIRARMRSRGRNG